MSREYNKLTVTEIDELPDGELPLAIDDFTVALRLGFRPRTMWWLMLKQGDAFKKFVIPKASGKLRTIHAPTPVMAVLLSQLRRKFLTNLTSAMGDQVTAYRSGKGIRDAVSAHIHKCEVCEAYDVPHTCDPVLEPVGTGYKIVKRPCKACDQPPAHSNCPRRGVKIHLDLKDFFNNTTRSQIQQYLTNDCKYPQEAAKTLAQLMTVDVKVERGRSFRTVRGVPQGGQTSGDICNLVAESRLDRLVLSKLRPLGWVYTRYADDLYLSHPSNLAPAAVNNAILTVEKCVEEAGWRVNKKKTAVQRPSKTQRLLGVSINRKPNIPVQAYRQMRFTIYRCWRDGFAAEAERNGTTTTQLMSKITGKLSWFNSLNEGKTARLKAMFEAAKEKHGGAN